MFMHSDPYGQTKEVNKDHPDWMNDMTEIIAKDPSPVRPNVPYCPLLSTCDETEL